MPYLTPRFAYAHMPKTGGCWFIRVLQSEGIGAHHGRPHTPLATVSAHARGARTPLASLRDPWSWYASWYAHAMFYAPSRRVLSALGNGSLAYRDVLRGATQPHTVKNLPLSFGAMWAFEDRGDHRDTFRVSGVGLWSWMAEYLYGLSAEPTLVMDTARLLEAVEELFGFSVDPERHPPANTGALREPGTPDPRSLYTADLLTACGRPTPRSSSVSASCPFSERPGR